MRLITSLLDYFNILFNDRQTVNFKNLASVKWTKFLLLFIVLSINLVDARLVDYRHFPDLSFKQQRVLLISFDGFRHDYIKAYNLVHFAEFLKDGSKAGYNNPQFTTESYPNHWSMVTGAFVETHGIVANNFYDPVYKEYFSKHKKDQLKWWNETEPIWSTAVKQGVKTGVFYWPGSEAPFVNSTLFTRVPFHEYMPFQVKVNQSLKWFLNEDYKFVLIYHIQPHAIFHRYGINSPEFNVTLQQLDESFGYLISQLKHRGLYHAEDFNTIVVSDHGMVNIKKNLIINEYIGEGDAIIWTFTKNLIHLKPLIDLESLLMKLSKMPMVTVTLKQNMPERLHYKNNRRVGEVIISALEGVNFIYMSRDAFHINHNGQVSTIMLTYEQKKHLLIAAADKANHGFDKAYPSMRGIFLARGSMFKQNFSTEAPIENIDIYPLICEILSINCDSRNGSIHRIKRFLKNENSLGHRSRIFQKQIMENCSTKLKSILFYIILGFLMIYFK